jgi:hypothetical protein
MIAALAGPLAAAPEWNLQGVVHNQRSPYAKAHAVPVRAVRMREGFWTARMKTNVERSIPTLLEQLEAHAMQVWVPAAP